LSSFEEPFVETTYGDGVDSWTGEFDDATMTSDNCSYDTGTGTRRTVPGTVHVTDHKYIRVPGIAYDHIHMSSRTCTGIPYVAAFYLHADTQRTNPTISNRVTCILYKSC